MTYFSVSAVWSFPAHPARSNLNQTSHIWKITHTNIFWFRDFRSAEHKVMCQCLEYLPWSFAAPAHMSAKWCQLSRRTQGGLGGRGSVAACPSQCGTTSDGRGTARSHSQTNANAGGTRERERARESKKKQKRCETRRTSESPETRTEVGTLSEGQFVEEQSDSMPRLTAEEEVAADISSTLPVGRMWCAGIVLHKKTVSMSLQLFLGENILVCYELQPKALK